MGRFIGMGSPGFSSAVISLALFRPALTVLGVVLPIVALMLLAPLVMAALENPANVKAYGITAITSGVLGFVCFLSGERNIRRITPRQMFMVTGLNWLVVTLVGALPFIIGETHLSVVDALFESTSGITTTGSTVMAGLDEQPRDILLWRSLLQWLGGLGIIGMAVAVFPYLRVGGMRLFQTESSDWTEASATRARQVAWNVVRSYLLLSLACVLVYHWLGMDWFNALNHMMTTVSTGGYSTSDASFGQFDQLSLLWAGIFFMLAGAVPFVLYFHSLGAHRLLVFRDQQVRGMLSFLGFVVLVLVGVRYLNSAGQDFFPVLTHSVFNVTSVMTTTGYASQDYGLWGGAAFIIFLCLMFVGGCSGSTSGGIKIFRFQLLAMLAREHSLKSVHPVAILKRHYNGRPVSEDILVSSISYFFLILASLAFFAVALAATGLDPMTSLTGAATALMNVGPGLGDVIGPAGNFSSLSETAKALLCGAMLLGRLEFLTLLVLFSPAYWRW
jgi:trk system potassium uptake protein